MSPCQDTGGHDNMGHATWQCLLKLIYFFRRARQAYMRDTAGVNMQFLNFWGVYVYLLQISWVKSVMMYV